jgi:hypothetical protein
VVNNYGFPTPILLDVAFVVFNETAGEAVMSSGFGAVMV